MLNEAPPVSLLAELDARQDELLDALAALNGQIESVIKEWSGLRIAEERQEKLPVAA